jgi:hypothetical protein
MVGDLFSRIKAKNLKLLQVVLPREPRNKGKPLKKLKSKVMGAWRNPAAPPSKRET